MMSVVVTICAEYRHFAYGEYYMYNMCDVLATTSRKCFLQHYYFRVTQRVCQQWVLYVLSGEDFTQSEFVKYYMCKFQVTRSRIFPLQSYQIADLLFGFLQRPPPTAVPMRNDMIISGIFRFAQYSNFYLCCFAAVDIVKSSLLLFCLLQLRLSSAPCRFSLHIRSRIHPIRKKYLYHGNCLNDCFSFVISDFLLVYEILYICINHSRFKC